MSWVAIILLAGGTYAIRVAGPLLRSRISISDGVKRFLSLGAVALLAALVATAAVFEGPGFAGIARPVGVAVGAVLAWLKLPFIVVVVAAAAVAALLRLAGVH
jgi:branched-subunit amino acid transport protein